MVGFFIYKYYSGDFDDPVLSNKTSNQVLPSAPVLIAIMVVVFMSGREGGAVLWVCHLLLKTKDNVCDLLGRGRGERERER